MARDVISPRLTDPAELQPALEKLEAYPGSVVLLAIEKGEPVCNFCRCTWAWLSSTERKALKAALIRARKHRDACAQEPRHGLGVAESSGGQRKRRMKCASANPRLSAGPARGRKSITAVHLVSHG